MIIHTKFKTVLFLLITASFFVASFTNADARRRYNPDKTRKQAIDIIRTTSEDVSYLAGLEPAISDSSIDSSLIYHDSENLENIQEGCPVPEDLIGEYGEDWEELEAEDDVPVDMEEFTQLWLNFVEEAEDYAFTEGGIKKQDIMNVIMDWLGTPYRFGGNSKKAIDCSAFVQQVFMATSNIQIPRTARTQVHVGDKIKRENLEFGDMIFFHTYSRRFPSHVGIYLGDNLFAHASSRYGVTVSSLESSYYNRRYIGARRITVDDLVKYSLEDTEEDIKLSNK
jgi:hypothetical protein